MFIRSLLPIAALAAVVAAAPGALQARQGECTTGPVQCCNSVKKGSELQDNGLAGLLGIVFSDPDELVGLQCSSVAGSSSCTQEPICCNGNSFNGLINLGCSPININL